MNECNEYVRECFSAAGELVIKPMMGGYLVYLNGKLIGDIGGKELFLKRTPTSDRLLAGSELRYPYEGSKTLMHVFDRFEDADLIAELLEAMLAELPERKPQKSKTRRLISGLSGASPVMARRSAAGRLDTGTLSGYHKA